jgi:hypothetical protein
VSGVIATVRLMFTAVSLQRWFLRASALLALVALAGMVAGKLGSPRWWTPVAILSACLLLAPSPPLVGAALLRSLGAPRAVRLIPHGRLQLLLGGLCAQVLVALIAGVAAATIVAYSENPQLHDHLSAAAAASAGLFVSMFAIATVSLIALYYASALRGGALILISCIVALKLLTIAFPNWHLRQFMTSASALLFTFIGALSLWALFAVGYLTAGEIRRPTLNQADGSLMHWLDAGDGRAPIAASERYATRVLLTGGRFGRRVTRSVVGIGVGVLCCYCLWRLRGNPIFNPEEDRFLAIMVAYTGGILATASIRPMVGRARYLWLKTRCDRGQLFQKVEAEGWRALLSVGVFALAVSAYISLLARVPWQIVVETLLLSFLSGIAMIYVMLLSTQERPVLHGILVTALSALWFFGLFYGLLQHDFRVTGSRLFLLLAPQLLLIPLLRTWSQSRWQRIDWIVNRPVPAGGETTW